MLTVSIPLRIATAPTYIKRQYPAAPHQEPIHQGQQCQDVLGIVLHRRRHRLLPATQHLLLAQVLEPALANIYKTFLAQMALLTLNVSDILYSKR
jgi:hypothetical protein